MSSITVAEAVGKHFEGANYFTDNGGDNNRLFGHDFLHTLLNAGVNSDRAEEVVAIYQAVLLGDACVTTRKDKLWQHMGDSPSMNDVKRITLPGARRFVDDIVAGLKRNHNLDPDTIAKFDKRSPLSNEHITECYQKACLLRRLFFAEFNRNMGDIPIKELRTMPFAPFKELMDNVERNYEVMKGKLHSPSDGKRI